VEPEDLTVQSGGAATFACAAAGDPLPSVSWRRRGEGGGGGAMLPPSAKVDNRAGSLTLQPASPRDEGVYVCRAESEAGIVEASASLAVHGEDALSVLK